MRSFSALTAILAILLAVVALAGCGGDDDEAGVDEVIVSLEEVDGSGQTATATLTAEGDQTRVSIAVDGDPVSPSQPAHIHEGTCGPDLNPQPAYGLPNVDDGTSESTVDATLDSLTRTDYAINLHMSNEDLTTYTSCGNIES